jgi:hypothetical protein
MLYILPLNYKRTESLFGFNNCKCKKQACYFTFLEKLNIGKVLMPGNPSLKEDLENQNFIARIHHQDISYFKLVSGRKAHHEKSASNITQKQQQKTKITQERKQGSKEVYNFSHGNLFKMNFSFIII